MIVLFRMLLWMTKFNKLFNCFLFLFLLDKIRIRVENWCSLLSSSSLLLLLWFFLLIFLFIDFVYYLFKVLFAGQVTSKTRRSSIPSYFIARLDFWGMTTIFFVFNIIQNFIDFVLPFVFFFQFLKCFLTQTRSFLIRHDFSTRRRNRHLTFHYRPFLSCIFVFIFRWALRDRLLFLPLQCRHLKSIQNIFFLLCASPFCKWALDSCLLSDFSGATLRVWLKRLIDTNR